MNDNDDTATVLDAIRARIRGSARTVRKVSPEELRKKYPAVQEAWEQYQLLLKLCSEQKD